MATLNLGRVGFVNKGAYSGATAYKVNDVVTYNSGTYACIQAHTGQLPTVTAYWQNWVSNDKALDSAVVHKTGDTMSGSLVVTSGNVLVAGLGYLGYGTGAGGTVTQLTSKGTSVTLNKPTGEIITSNEALVSNAETVFVVNNSLVTTRDGVTVNSSSTNKYTTICQGVFSGGFYIRVKNVTGGSLSESFSINFDITKGANA